MVRRNHATRQKRDVKATAVFSKTLQPSLLSNGAKRKKERKCDNQPDDGKKKKELSMLCAIFWMVYRFSLFGKKKRNSTIQGKTSPLCVGGVSGTPTYFCGPLLGLQTSRLGFPLNFFGYLSYGLQVVLFFSFIIDQRCPFRRFLRRNTHNILSICTHTWNDRADLSVVIRIEVSESWKRKSLQSCIF